MIILILILFFNSINISPIRQVYALENNQTYFARVLFEQVYLYKSAEDNNSYSNIYFEIPRTYFVELLESEGNFFKARYKSFSGYVKKDSVQATSSTPLNPYLSNVNFRVFAEMSETLWSQPSTQSPSKQISTLPHLTKDLEYIGKINGECLINGRTNTWYYCKFTQTNSYGYVYSDFCDELVAIPTNNENVTYISNPTFTETITTPNAIPKESNAVGIIVTILSIPALIFILLLLKGKRILGNSTLKSREIVDY